MEKSTLIALMMHRLNFISKKANSRIESTLKAMLGMDSTPEEMEID
jgi:hypothetical protein